ncbi:ribosome maturation factor RimP [Aureibacillus halotolerans]|uniref:Ribosome maturation factor RimP n=1 Tax=Aureibacillus halotolerans TaxID=1508390 RepID=A0A4R6U4I0_9BACI|nr:ribosome maturation factor RimP [Aureibacillus halotolerans]TDQ39683.1 ribosome maturation factor RimP [Aureibacillus halotolerans]
MSKKSITELTEEQALPILKEMGLELVDTEFIKEGKHWYLRVYIDREGGVDIEDCSNVNERLSAQLDELDPVNVPYFLDVSSPGAERPLKKEQDYIGALGSQVHIKTYEPIAGQKAFEGRLESYNSEQLTLIYMEKTREITVEIPTNKVAKARLAVTF